MTEPAGRSRMSRFIFSSHGFLLLCITLIALSIRSDSAGGMLWNMDGEAEYVYDCMCSASSVNKVLLTVATLFLFPAIIRLVRVLRPVNAIDAVALLIAWIMQFLMAYTDNWDILIENIFHYENYPYKALVVLYLFTLIYAVHILWHEAGKSRRERAGMATRPVNCYQYWSARSSV